jgi:hypothetical protein
MQKGIVLVYWIVYPLSRSHLEKVPQSQTRACLDSALNLLSVLCNPAYKQFHSSTGPTTKGPVFSNLVAVGYLASGKGKGAPGF